MKSTIKKYKPIKWESKSLKSEAERFKREGNINNLNKVRLNVFK